MKLERLKRIKFCVYLINAELVMVVFNSCRIGSLIVDVHAVFYDILQKAEQNIKILPGTQEHS